MGRMLWIVLAVLGIGLLALMATHDSGSVMGMRSDNFASLLYLGVLGVVIAAGVLSSGMRVGTMVRSIALWAMVILVLVAGYQYRYELQDVASRVTAGLIPGSPLAMVDEDGRAAVMLERMAGGHFEVMAEFDGAPVRVMVDTGATSTVLSYADAERVGLDPASLPFTVPIMTANGAARAAQATASEIRIGDIVRSRVPVLVASEGRLDRSLLGMNFIGTLSGFDMRGERLILRD